MVKGIVAPATFHKYFPAAILILAIVALAGCTQYTQLGEGLVLSIQSKQSVFEGEDVKFFVDVENRDYKDYNNVEFSIFDTGFLTGECTHTFGTIKPGETKTFSCELTASKINTQDAQNEANARLEYETSLRFVKNVEVISEQERERRRLTGRLEEEDGTQTFADSSLSATVSFNEPLPLVDRGKAKLLFLNIANIGSGIPGGIGEGKIDINSRGLLKQECGQTDLVLLGGQYPQVTCELNEDEMNKVEAKSSSTYSMMFDIQYSYDVRDKIVTEIRK